MASEQVALFQRLAPRIRREAGCLGHDLFRVQGDDRRFILLERWHSREAFAAHEAAAHTAEAEVASVPLRAAWPTVTFITPVR